MTTIINTPGAVDHESESGLGIVLGVIVGIGLIVLFFVYILPTIRANPGSANNPTPSDTNITVINPPLPAPVIPAPTR